jgi:hypothetical protein
LGWRKRIIKSAIEIESEEVTKTFIYQVFRFEHTIEPTILPTLAFTDQNASSNPLLPFPNQFPMVAIIPGHPVLWKNPLKPIATRVNGLLSVPETEAAIAKLAKLPAASIIPIPRYQLSFNLFVMEPMVAIPKE